MPTEDGRAAVGVRSGVREGPRNWRRWTPSAAVAWSLAYAALAAYWAVSGRGFPYTTGTAPDALGPLIGRLHPGAAWIAVALAGIPAACVGTAMLRGVRGTTLRPLLIAAAALLGAILLLMMTGLTLLVLLGYVPYVVVGLFTGSAITQKYLAALTQWPVVHQVLCLVGGFLWLAAAASYTRSSGGGCPHCGRRDRPEGWQTPNRAARWGRTAVYVSAVAPIFYAVTRYGWALGFPLGMSEEQLRQGQGAWVMSGVFLATFGLLGVVLTFGLVQRWGEVFPRWMVGLAGRRVPIALAVVPASLVSVLLIVGGTAVWSELPRMIARLGAGGADGAGVVGALVSGVGAVLLFPVWGVALAAAALAYYYRRRPPCEVCGQAASRPVPT